MIVLASGRWRGSTCGRLGRRPAERDPQDTLITTYLIRKKSRAPLHLIDCFPRAIENAMRHIEKAIRTLKNTCHARNSA